MGKAIIINPRRQTFTTLSVGRIPVHVFLMYGMSAIIKLSIVFSLLIFAGCSPEEGFKPDSDDPGKILQHNSQIISSDLPGLHNAIYVENEGSRLLSKKGFSEDNGQNWRKYSYIPDFQSGLPYGYRRNRVVSLLDHFTGRIITIINSLDTPDLDPSINEPPVAQSTYYLRYSVSNDAAKTWLHEDPIIQEGNYSVRNPIEGVVIGNNSIYLGDIGCVPIVTKKGKILVPAQTTLAAPDSGLLNPGGGWTYTDVIILIGTWTEDNKLSWKISQRVEADPKRSTRGMIEPTLLELQDGRILVVMRGSNGGAFDTQYKLPSYRWFSVSEDGGETWSKPEPWGFEDGELFFSPSSMSRLFKHSSGRCFWVGNMSNVNCQGNLPRYPIVIAEINTENLKLIPSSLLKYDFQRGEDFRQGRLDLCHMAVMEDRETKEIILTYPRNHNKYTFREWVTARFSVSEIKKKK